jgi:exodeoxyribonuclease VII small subunit
MTVTTYKEAFSILKQNVDILRRDEGEDIDSLVEIMKTSTAAYNLCMERISSVKNAIEQYSTHTPEESTPIESFSSESSTSIKQQSVEPVEFSDIPF